MAPLKCQEPFGIKLYHACISADLKGLVFLKVCRQVRLKPELAQMDFIVLNSEQFGLVLLLEIKEMIT